MMHIFSCFCIFYLNLTQICKLVLGKEKKKLDNRRRWIHTGLSEEEEGRRSEYRGGASTGIPLYLFMQQLSIREPPSLIMK